MAQEGFDVPGKNAWERWFFGGRKGPMPTGGGSQSPSAENITIPPPPSITDTDTGVVGAGGATTEAGQAQEFLDASKLDAEADFQAKLGAQANAEDFAAGVSGQVSDTGERIEGIQDDLSTRQDDLDARLSTALDDVAKIPEEILTQFEKLHERFGTVAAAALTDIDSKAETAMNSVMEGRSSVMQAAVQGIQGNVNSAIAQIQSDPNLTQSQKTSMIAQTKLAGASALAPAIGANILAFNQLQANVAMTFGGLTAGLQTQIISEEGAFGRAEGQAFADATVASQQITSTLLGIQGTADAAFANSQATLEGVRSQAEMSGNQLLLDNMPNLTDPVLNTVDTAAATMIIGTDLVTREYERVMMGVQQQITMMLVKDQIGTPGSRIAEGFWAGLEQFGLVGGFLGAGAAAVDNVSNPSPTFG